MQIRLTLRSRAGTGDIEIEALPEATVGDLRAQLAEWSTGCPPTLWAGSRALSDNALLGGPGVRSGCIVGVDTPGRRSTDLGAVLHLDVVGGPDAGAGVALHRGAHHLGRDQWSDLLLSDPEVSRRHIELTVDAAGARVRDLDSTNGATLLLSDGRELPVGSEAVPLTLGSRVRLGNSVVQLAQLHDPPAVTQLDEAGHLQVNRPPRLEVRADPVVVTFPAEAPSSRTPTSWLAALVPILGGIGMAALFRSWIYLALMLMAPLTMLATTVPERIRGRPSRRRAAELHRHEVATAETALTNAVQAQLASRLRLSPDPAEVRRIATGPTSRIWERRCVDPDFLDVRVGLTDVDAEITVEGPADPPRLPLVPVTVSLRTGAVGVCGPRQVGNRLVHWAIGQVAALHSPNDVSLALLLPDRSPPADLHWTWLSWLPHLARGRTARGADDCRELVIALGRELDRRQTAHSRATEHWPGPWLVVVLVGASSLAAVPGLDRLIRDGPRYGVTALCVDTELRRLPSGCASIVEVGGETGAEVAVRAVRRPPVGSVIADQVSAPWCDEIARGLAPLVDPSRAADAALPSSARLVELLTDHDLDSTELQQRWAQSDGAPATVIGVGVDAVVELDLSRDGPHLLVAGTTGSGKSEFLQALVAGLAVNCSPGQLNFVLIDFKGGAAFAECAELPHAVGLVTDLDQHLTERALVSLNAELRRRENMFATAGVADLAAFQATAAGRSQSLPRLVIVVDEFATLVEELPDFVTGLVGIAQRGRSLGVHLVLATQRPSGVVSAEIRANMPLRLALRVTDPSDSLDVVGTADAAAVSPAQPGRAYLRRGTEVLAVQVGRVGGSAPRSPSGIRVIQIDAWGLPTGGSASDSAVGPASAPDLARLVASARQAALDGGLPAPRRPWLPPLPDVVAVGQLPGSPPDGIGLVDDPAAQSVRIWSPDLHAGGSTLLVGTGRTGRSSALRTLAATMAARAGPDAAHLYVIDCAGGGLQPLSRLPHCGGYVTRDDPQTVDRLLTRLATACDERHDRTGDPRDPPARPMMLLIIDGWEGLLAATESVAMGQPVETVLHLIREAGSVGLTVMITGGRSALTSRLAGLVDTRVVFRLADPSDYAAAGLSVRTMPAGMPPGRAVFAEYGTEVQLAVLGADPSPPAQWAQVAAIAAHSPAAPAESAGGPLQIRALPPRIPAADVLSRRPGAGIVLGLGGDSCTPFRLDLDAPGGRFVVAGPTRSGRSSALRLIAGQARPTSVLLAGPAESGLGRWARARGRPLVTPQQTTRFDLPGGARPLLIVDDVERFLDTPAGDRLVELLLAAPTGASLVAAGRTDDLVVSFRGLGAEAIRPRLGVLLRPAPGDGEVLGVRLPLTRASGPPGRGIMIAGRLLRDPALAGEDLLPVQLADPGPIEEFPIG
ncbi:MAG: FtsK/SpoIIIE domain-containing protein [Jatrophihabitans sp.]